MDSDSDENTETSFTLPEARRALSFDEFRILYQRQKQADLARLRQTGHTGPWLNEMRQRRDRVLSVGQQEAGNGRAGPSPFTAATAGAAPRHFGPAQQPRPQQQQQEDSLLTVVYRACLAAVMRIGQLAIDHWLLLLQISITSVAMFGSVSWKNVLFTTVIFAVMHSIKWVATGLRVERPGRPANDGPTPLGRLFLRLGAPAAPAPAGHAPPPVSIGYRVGYMVLKCVETFALSLWPNYSLENLEAQLQRDGIVRARPVVVGPPAPTAVAPSAAAVPPPQPEGDARPEEDANPPVPTPWLEEIE